MDVYFYCGSVVGGVVGASVGVSGGGVEDIEGVGAWVRQGANGEEDNVGEEKGGGSEEDESVGGDAEKAGTMAAIGDIGSGEGSSGGKWREYREEEPCFFVRKNGVEGHVA